MIMLLTYIFISLSSVAFTIGERIPCALRDYGNERRVCVCNATYCDTLPREPAIPKGQFVAFTSSKEGLRFQRTKGRLSNYLFSESRTLSWLSSSTIPNTASFTVDISKTYQKIQGFGGAFTDAAGMNILSLSKKTQEQLLRSYFSNDGIEYNLCRLPVGGTDFSSHPYSYDDGPPDPQLTQFSLTKEDLKYKIPMIQRAQSLSERDIQLVAASWSPPKWMKTNGDYSGFGFLKEEYFDTYAKYFLRFLDEYKKHNVSIWAMSTGNEPSNGVLPFKHFNSLGWTPLTLANWTANYLGPQLRRSPHRDTRLLAFDDQRLFLPWWIDLMVKANTSVLDYLDGFAVHWYWDFMVGSNVINAIHDKYSNKFILYTEACVGDKPWELKVDLGSWERGEKYIDDIIQNLNVWVTGWLDWNMALDLRGGPSWAKNYVDSPVLVNSSADEFYKQPMYYAMAHVAKYIERGAARVDVTPAGDNGVSATATHNTDGRTVIVLFNKNNDKMETRIQVVGKGWIELKVPPRSFVTVLC